MATVGSTLHSVARVLALTVRCASTRVGRPGFVGV